MPKSTFYRISEEKQNRIMNAARNEFLSVPYSEVSINRIIKEAEIPRGSFYQYFDGKEDLFYFVLQENKNSLLRTVTREIEKTDGDIFKGIENHIDRLVEFIYYDNSGKVRMLFSEPWIFETIWMAVMKEKTCEGSVSNSLISKIDCSLLDIDSEEELMLLVSILAAVLKDSIGKIFVCSDQIDEAVAKDMIRAKIHTLKCHYSKKINGNEG